MEGSFNENEDLVEPITYICGECGNDVALQSTAAVRCRNCGSRILYKKRSYRELKDLAEHLYSTQEEQLVAEYEKFELFREKLNSLLSTVAKYRIQLSASEDKMVFGPKTLKTVQSIVANYDKLYEIYEDHLYNIFTPVEHLYQETVSRSSAVGDSEEARLKSITEETKSHLERIEEDKRKLQEQQSRPLEVDFSAIQKNELVFDTILTKILEIFKQDPCDDLEKILVEIHEAHEVDFQRIVTNVSNLLREISRKPDEVAFRILRINNTKLQSDFLECHDSVKILKFAGFRIATTPEVQQHLTQLNVKLDEEYLLYLHEPDMFAHYNRWKDWFNNINNISTTLTSFLSKYKRLRRSELDPRSLISKALD